MPPLRFGFLTYALDRPAFGISRAALGLGEALAGHAEAEPVFINSYKHGPFSNGRYTHAYLPGAGLLPGLMTIGAVQLPSLAARNRLSLVHDPIGVSPFITPRSAGSYKRVVTIHDATSFRYPETHSRLDNFLQRAYVPALIRNVDAVITVSQASRHDIVRYLKVPEARVHVVPWAADARFKPVPADEAIPVALRYGLRPPFVLFVGALEPRKNVPTLLRAFARLRPDFPDLTLGLCGSPRWRFNAIPQALGELAQGGTVPLTGYVSEEDLPAVYSAASVFCFPSLYEGFGLPALEAMACGTPVVCSNTSSLPEVVGDAALLVDPLDIGALTEALRRVLSDPPLAEELRRRGLRRAATFSWDKTAEMTLGVYRGALAN